ncbi:ABC transporter family substrate-binding protein [Streptomyces spinoverrucosus]|uniref:ABC transporter family substrate-binding protein n=1 Tax=Streptomyces spinoverrucosus TaxID=284043 RepID=UPI0018C3D415|nr:ABC transporter family substrate-binding protein [Streptomyces spinoverrucosus]MBG0852723.1 ABC transporter family substrate-binding protein [Streptomyces spinoverrucosus]
MSHDGVGPRAVMRSVAFLTAGVLLVPALAGCGSDDEAGKPLAGQDIAPAARARVADGGTLRWAVDSVPETLNTFQADADATTATIAQAVLPSMYRMNDNGRPEINPDYLESAEVVETEPRQVVLYKLNQQAVWSDGREIGAADFAAQWRALSGKDSAYWTARNAGYDRIERIERGKNNLEVKVTFSRTYADWKSLFTPLYPKEVMGTPDAFNDGARTKLKVTAGPFTVQKVDKKKDEVTLVRSQRWWGEPAKLSKIVLVAVGREKRAEALAAGSVDVADVDAATAQRIDLAGRPKGTGTPLQGAKAEGAEDMRALARYEVRKSLEPTYTQLALNGADGPLADERVRRAVARALDRKELAEAVLKPLGLPAQPVGSHLALSGQAAYADNSGALGGQDTKEAEALLADAGWVRGGPLKEPKKKEEKAAGAEGESASPGAGESASPEAGESTSPKAGESAGEDDGTYIVGEDGKAGEDPEGRDHEDDRADPRNLAQDGKQHAGQGGGAQGAYAPKGTAAPGAAAGTLAKDGKPLTLRFVLPSGPGSDTLHRVADRIARMLQRVGIRTETTKVSDASYFKDHIANGEYDLALYSWPASAFPATDARPIYAKPVPAADGSLTVEQNYTRVGTDQVDQLFDQAIATLDEEESRELVRKADSRIWAAAGSIPLYQRPQLTAVRKNLANTGSFGFETPVYQDMGFLKKTAKKTTQAARD